MKKLTKVIQITELDTILNSPINEFIIVLKNDSIFLETKSCIIIYYILARVEEWCIENNCHYFTSLNSSFKLHIRILSNIE